VARTNGRLVHRIRDLKDKLIRDGVITTLHLSWVPGHAGLPGNTQADFLASRGAEASQSDKGVLDIPRCLELLIFVPD
jgi:ribonuclease HI